MTTVLETIDGGTRYLEKHGIEDARRNMQMLVANQLGCTRMELYTQFDRQMEEEDLVPLRDVLKRRGEGVPLQHLIGKVWFHRHEFQCDARGLIPRPETEELVERVLKWQLSPVQRVLDMGCGSGVLGLSLADERPEWNVTLADISPDALALAQENAATLEIPNVSFLESDLFSAIEGEFDIIAANLPYVPDVNRATLTREVMHDPALALFSGADGLDLIRQFIPSAYSRLKPGGWLIMEIGHDQASQVSEILKACGFTAIDVAVDISGISRFPIARKPVAATDSPS
jgi:release factor glutamine methyltransferase